MTGRMAGARFSHVSATKRATHGGMAGQLVGELIKKRTRAGDPWFVGHAHGQRLTLFFVEVRTDDRGELVEVFELRAEPVPHAPPYETAPPRSRRVDGLANGQRPVSAAPSSRTCPGGQCDL